MECLTGLKISPLVLINMVEKSSVFEKTYKDYLAQIARIDLKSIEEKLDIRVEGEVAVIPFFGEPYRVSEKGIIDPSGKKPSFDKCIILCKYLLLNIKTSSFFHTKPQPRLNDIPHNNAYTACLNRQTQEAKFEVLEAPSNQQNT